MQQVEEPSGSRQPPDQFSSAQAERVTINETKDEGSETASGISEKEQSSLEEDEEEMECGFCLFMKGGGCKENFIAWEKCVEEAEKNKEDIVEKCFEVTGLLKKCMEAHADYYEPILRAEKVMEEEAKQELDRERAGAGDSEGASQHLERNVQSDSPATEGKEAKQELNDSHTASGDPEQKGPSRSSENAAKAGAVSSGP